MHTDSVTSFALDGYFLFSGSCDHTIVMWNLENYTHVGVLQGHKAPIQDLMMLKNGFLVSCAFDTKIIIWDYTGRIIETLTWKRQEFRCIAYIEKIGKLFAGTNDKDILIFDISHVLELKPRANEDSDRSQIGLDSDLDGIEEKLWEMGLGGEEEKKEDEYGLEDDSYFLDK